MTALGPAPDRAVLARAEADWRATPPDLAGWVSLSRDASRALMAEYDRRGAELDRLHSWAGLIELLDEHWPADIFPGGGESKDLGPRVVGLIRELDRQRGERVGLEGYIEDKDLQLDDLRAELERQRVIVRAAEALVECDAAKPGLGQSISVWRRQRRELLDALAAAVRAPLEGEGR